MYFISQAVLAALVLCLLSRNAEGRVGIEMGYRDGCDLMHVVVIVINVSKSEYTLHMHNALCVCAEQAHFCPLNLQLKKYFITIYPF